MVKAILKTLGIIFKKSMAGEILIDQKKRANTLPIKIIIIIELNNYLETKKIYKIICDKVVNRTHEFTKKHGNVSQFQLLENNRNCKE